MVAIGNKKGSNASRSCRTVIDSQHSDRKKRRPVILLVSCKTTKVVFQNLVDIFSRTISFRIVGVTAAGICRHLADLALAALGLAYI